MKPVNAENVRARISQIERAIETMPGGFSLGINHEFELARLRKLLSCLESELVAWDYEWASYITCEGPQDFKRIIEHEAPPGWAIEEGRARNIIPLYLHAQQPVVDADDNFYSWFGREWQENYQHNQYTTAAKQMLGVMAESAWKAGHRAAMLQAGNSPEIPGGWISVSERLPDDEQEVIAQTHSGWRYVAFYDEHSGLFYDSPEGDVEYVLVTYWQPLPAPPQEVTSARVHPARE